MCWYKKGHDHSQVNDDKKDDDDDDEDDEEN